MTSASRIPVVVHRTKELLTASSRQQVLSHADARSRLEAPKPVFEVSRISELSGPHAPDGRVPVAGAEHFERCDTRWHYELAEEPVPKGSERRPPGMRTRVRTLPQGARDGLDGDTERLVRFCSGYDRLLSPILAETIPTGHPPSKPARR